MTKSTGLAIAVLLSALASPGTLEAQEGVSRSTPAMTSAVALAPQEILARLEARNQEREMRLAAYTVRRTYYVINYRTGRQARQEVLMSFRAPNHKEFQELSASGSKFLRNRVFRPLMKSELEALEPQLKRLSGITRVNYDFSLLGETTSDGRRQYVLNLTPKRKEKYLIAGKVWVDAEDFAIARIEGRPAKRLSFWTRRVAHLRQYRKISEFWLPAADESLTEVFLFGRSDFSIRYGDYQITPAANASDNSAPTSQQP